MAAQAKDVIYIDIEDEITTIIDKVKSAQAKIVALVLPKRAAVFQSSVNMKLLKKAADQSRKRAVLITNDSNLLPLAGSIGLYVAKNLQSKPEIPDFDSSSEADKTIDTLEVPDEGAGEPKADFDQAADADKSVGELADKAEGKKAKPELTPMAIPLASEAEDAIELDNEKKEEPDAEDKPKGESKKGAKDKNLKVPNFNKFRNRLIIGIIVLILLIVGWVLLSNVLAKATITITSKTTPVNANLNLTLSPTASSVNQASQTLPAHLQQTQNTVSQSANTTGQQNKGNAATGSVDLVEQECSPPFHTPSTIPAGTGLSANSLTFITQGSTTFSNQGKIDNSGCIDFSANNSTQISAQSGGSNYNLAGAQFTDQSNQSVSGSGTTSGGTDDIVQTVSQTDINNATAKLTTPTNSSAKSQLESSLTKAGYYPLPSTFSAGTPTTSTSANVGDQASSVTVTQTTTYTMFGVQQTDLKSLLDDNIDSQIDTSTQSIISDGFNSASYSATNVSASSAQLAMQATAQVGLHLNLTTLKKQVAGKKTGQVDSLVSNDPGVTNVKVNLSPFWVSSVPNNTSKITIVLQSATHAKRT